MTQETANTAVENVVQFKYFGLTAANQTFRQAEIRGKLNSNNTYYHSVQKLLSTSLLSKNAKVRLYRTLILPVVFYGC
jgi:hypothetical protein